jgi:hypothetical protein
LLDGLRHGLLLSAGTGGAAIIPLGGFTAVLGKLLQRANGGFVPGTKLSVVAPRMGDISKDAITTLLLNRLKNINGISSTVAPRLSVNVSQAEFFLALNLMGERVWYVRHPEWISMSHGGSGKTISFTNRVWAKQAGASDRFTKQPAIKQLRRLHDSETVLRGIGIDVDAPGPEAALVVGRRATQGDGGVTPTDPRWSSFLHGRPDGNAVRAVRVTSAGRGSDFVQSRPRATVRDHAGTHPGVSRAGNRGRLTARAQTRGDA